MCVMMQVLAVLLDKFDPKSDGAARDWKVRTTRKEAAGLTLIMPAEER